MFWVMILIIVLVVYFYYRNSDSYRESKVFKSNWINKRVKENISDRLQHIWILIPYEIKSYEILAHNCSVDTLSNAIFKAIDVGQLTMGELKEIEGNISRFSVEFEIIRLGKLNEVDKKELNSELSKKMFEYLNQKIASLNYRAGNYSNKVEKENIKKRIEKL